MDLDDAVKSHRKRNDGLWRRVKKQAYDSDVWRSATAEFLATFLFLFIVCMTYMMPTNVATLPAENGQPKYLQASIGIALAYTTLIQCFEKISGGFMNPAVSVGMLIAGNISGFKAILFTIAQMTGAFSAVALCFGLFPNHAQQERLLPKLHDNISPLQGFGIEVLQSFILTVAWLATYLTTKQQLGSSAFPVGVAVLGNSLWAEQLVGSSSNPACSIPPAIISRKWENLWVFSVGPLVGSVFGALLYVHVFLTGSCKKKGKIVNNNGRNVEGESMKSDQEAMEPLQGPRHEAEVQTTNFIMPLSESPSCQQQSSTLYSLNNLQDPECRRNASLSNVSSLTRTGRYHLPQIHKFSRQASVPVQRTQSMHHSMSYAPSNGSNSTNVTLTRESSRVPSRSSTSCGPLTNKALKHNGNLDSFALTKFSNYHRANAMDPLLSEEIR